LSGEERCSEIRKNVFNIHYVGHHPGGVLRSGFSRVKGFHPKIWNYSAELDVDVVSDTDETEFDSGSTKTQDNYAREVVSFWLNGYVYHKRFIRYYLGLSAGLNQENITINDEDSGWRTGSGTGYDFRAVILLSIPTSSYSLRGDWNPSHDPGYQRWETR